MKIRIKSLNIFIFSFIIIFPQLFRHFPLLLLLFLFLSVPLAQTVACLPLVQQVLSMIPDEIEHLNFEARRGEDVQLTIARLCI